MAPQVRCVKCGKNTPAEVAYCVYCGEKHEVFSGTPETSTNEAPLQAPAGDRTRNMIIGVVAFVAVIVFVAVACGILMSGNHTPTEPQEIVFNSAWDGSVAQVKTWLENEYLKDPRSVEYIEWSPVFKFDTGRFQVRVKYRAKNSFGGYVVEEKLVRLDKNGEITEVTDYK